MLHSSQFFFVVSSFFIPDVVGHRSLLGIAQSAIDAADVDDDVVKDVVSSAHRYELCRWGGSPAVPACYTTAACLSAAGRRSWFKYAEILSEKIIHVSRN